MPELDKEAAGVLTASEQILYEHCQRDGMPASKLKELIQEVLHHPDFDTQDVDHDLHDRVMRAISDGDIEVHDMWVEGDGVQDVRFFRRPGLKVLQELLGDPRLAGRQHFGFQEYKDPRTGERIVSCEANGTVTFQLAQLRIGPDKVPVSIVLYADGSFLKNGIPARAVYRKSPRRRADVGPMSPRCLYLVCIDDCFTQWAVKTTTGVSWPDRLPGALWP
jgi:hypothetical protein